jgi:hypothetical protein
LGTNRGRYVEVFDDFTQVLDNSGAATPHILSDSGVWRARHTTGTFAAGAGAAAFGELSLTRASGSAEAYIGKETAWMVMRQAAMRFICRSRSSGVANGKCEIGLTDTADATPGDATAVSTLSLFYDFTALGNNWHIRVRAVSVDAFVNTGVAVNTSANQRIEIVAPASGPIFTVSIDGVVVASPSAVSLNPATVGFPFARFSGDSASHGLVIESLHFRSLTARW